MRITPSAICIFLLLWISCTSESGDALHKTEGNYKDSLIVPAALSLDSRRATDTSAGNPDSLRPAIRYPFLQTASESATLAQRISPPEEYRRVNLKPGSFAEWLRYLPLYPPDRKVYLYNGNLKGNQFAQAAVINMDVGKRDLQQCADAVMRLRGEYLWGESAFDKIHFNYTSGDRVAFEDWSRGRKPRVSGNRVLFSAPGTSIDTSYANFRSYMNSIFNYAGTASLSKELIPVKIIDLKAGDVFIQGGFPGHAVIVLDVAERSTGEKCFLLAQSYMPAQDMHVLQNPVNETLSPWYSTDFGEDLITPEWPFKQQDLKRFPE